MSKGSGKDRCGKIRFDHAGAGSVAAKLSFAAIAVALVLSFTRPSPAQLVAAQQASKPDGAIAVFSAPDESSLQIESVKKGAVLSPIAESTGAGGEKWYMVRTVRGAVGWIKADHTPEAKNVKKYFDSLPKEKIIIGPGSFPPTPKGSPPPGSIAIPVQSAGSALLVPVTINNSLDAYLLLDTGATITMLSSRIAKRLALQTIGAGTALTVGGPVSQSIARLESLKVGEAEVQNLPVAVHDFHPDPRIGGLLGLDFLGRFHVSLDAKRRLLVLSPR